MKMIVAVALAFMVAFAAARPGPGPEQEPTIPIVRSNFNQSPEGGFQLDFETGNGIVQNIVGELKQVLDEDKKPHEVVVFRGSYSYPGEDGKPVAITYFADETGYHAEGDAIPKPARR